MASQGPKSAASVLLVLNLVLYFIVIVIASWAVNRGIEMNQHSASQLELPLRIFPIYFPMGNMATGFFVILSLFAGVVGFTTSLTGLQNVFLWKGPNLHTSAASSLAAWALTLLAMGLACKEIELGWENTDTFFQSWKHNNLRTLEVMTIIVSVTQMFSTFAIQAGVEENIAHQKLRTGRV